MLFEVFVHEVSPLRTQAFMAWCNKSTGSESPSNEPVRARYERVIETVATDREADRIKELPQSESHEDNNTRQDGG
jgi:hypothetical protein